MRSWYTCTRGWVSLHRCRSLSGMEVFACAVWAEPRDRFFHRLDHSEAVIGDGTKGDLRCCRYYMSGRQYRGFSRICPMAVAEIPSAFFRIPLFSILNKYVWYGDEWKKTHGRWFTLRGGLQNNLTNCRRSVIQILSLCTANRSLPNERMRDQQYKLSRRWTTVCPGVRGAGPYKRQQMKAIAHLRDSSCSAGVFLYIHIAGTNWL